MLGDSLKAMSMAACRVIHQSVCCVTNILVIHRVSFFFSFYCGCFLICFGGFYEIKTGKLCSCVGSAEVSNGR